MLSNNRWYMHRFWSVLLSLLFSLNLPSEANEVSNQQDVLFDIYIGVVQSMPSYVEYNLNYNNYSEMRHKQPIASLVDDLGHSVEVLQRTGLCNVYDSARNFADILTQYNNITAKIVIFPKKQLDISRLKAFLLSDCEETCSLIGRMGSAMVLEGLPVISQGCGSPEFSNPAEYSTFARVGGMFGFLADPMARLFVHFNVSRVVVVSSLDMAMELTRAAFNETFKRLNIKSFEHQLSTAALPLLDLSDSTATLFSDAAKYIKENARYVVLLLGAHDVVRLMKVIKDEYEVMLKGEYIFFTVDYRIMTVDEFPDISDDELAQIQERLVTGNRKPFTGDVLKQSKVDGDSDYGYVVDSQLVLFDAIKYTQPDMRSADISRRLRSGQLSITGLTGQVALDEQGTRRPEYIFLIVQNGRLMPLWTLPTSNRTGATWINPEPVKWPLSPFPPDPSPVCNWDNTCAKSIFSLDKNSKEFRNTLILIGCLCAVVLILLGFWLYRIVSHKMAKRTAMEWVIKWPDLTFPTDKHEEEKEEDETEEEEEEEVEADKELEEEEEDHTSLSDTNKAPHPSSANPHVLSAVYQHLDVAVKRLVDCPSVNMDDKDILEDIRKMRSVKHENVVEFIGICIEAPNVAIVMFHTQRGSLQDVILTCDKRILSLDFLASLITDVCKGMEYLHTTEIGSHGHLSSTKCLVDMRWTCRISGYGMGHLRKCKAKDKKLEDASDKDDDELYKDMMYVAPELLRLSRRDVPLYGTKEADVYSFSIILQEAVLVSQPYAIDLYQFTGKEIISQVRAKSAEIPFRPSLGECSHLAWAQLIRDCWAERPEARPTFHDILMRLERLSKDFNLGFIEKLMLKLEQHAINLQEMVRNATENIVKEKAKVDSLLYSLLPKVIADDLKLGKTTKPEKFSSATIYFSDIVGFTKIAAMSTPMQIVTVLNSLYREYDAVTDRLDAYKVETIGDSYMVVSGIPIRNGKKHAVEIARLAVQSLDVLTSYKMEHLPGTPVQARIGIHSGATLAGVVGLKMPRYCLFGESVLIASKMESSGEANKIHISQSTAKLLVGTKGFVLESRGEREIIKDVIIKTYFLRRTSKEEVFAWLKGKALPSKAATITSTSPTKELSPYMVEEDAPLTPPSSSTKPTAPDPIDLKGHDGRQTDNGIVYVFSAKNAE